MTASDTTIANMARRMRRAERKRAELGTDKRPWHELYAASCEANDARSELRRLLDGEAAAMSAHQQKQKD